MRKLLIALLAVLAAVPAALAQERKACSQAELDQMLAPVALYPDSLLSQVLLYIGLTMTSVGQAAVLFNMRPFFTLLSLPLLVPAEPLEGG